MIAGRRGWACKLSWWFGGHPQPWRQLNTTASITKYRGARAPHRHIILSPYAAYRGPMKLQEMAKAYMWYQRWS